MHPHYDTASSLTEAINSAKVHKDKGTGLVESINVQSLEKELGLR